MILSGFGTQSPPAGTKANRFTESSNFKIYLNWLILLSIFTLMTVTITPENAIANAAIAYKEYRC
uniref:Uncharacterized protein n=1 Tax=Glossina palpalis gambiensis TaxID=67801 RepID=A0A1B0BMW9_9MUSC